MKTEIHIVSYAHDLPYLEYCLKSIKKFASGFSGVTLVVPTNEFASFKNLLEHHLPTLMVVELLSHDLPGHLGAQCAKCLADQHCPDAEFILHLDSDCVFTEPVTPEDYFVNGKPVMCIEAYERLPHDHPWRGPTERALGGPVHYETMRRHPQVNPRGLYADLRRRIEEVHDVDFVSYVLAQKPDFPWGFSEHCALGAFAIDSPEWREQYHWIDLATEPMPKSKLMQFWSHGSIDAPQALPSGGYECPRAVFTKLGL